MKVKVFSVFFAILGVLCFSLCRQPSTKKLSMKPSAEVLVTGMDRYYLTTCFLGEEMTLEERERLLFDNIESESELSVYQYWFCSRELKKFPFADGQVLSVFQFRDNLNGEFFWIATFYEGDSSVLAEISFEFPLCVKDGEVGLTSLTRHDKN